MFGIKKVAELTDIPAVTLRAWERRYDVIKPIRADNNTRMYTQEHINDILWIKQMKEEKGIPVHQAMELLKQRKDESQQEAHLPVPPLVLSKYEEYSSKLYSALTTYDINEANRIIHLCFAMFDFEEVIHYIFKPVLYQVGEAWHGGKVEVSQEHFISNFLKNKITTFFQTIPSESLRRVKAVAFCPPNEVHELGLVLFSLFLNRRGIEVLFLGQNVPIESIPPFLKATNTHLICITITLSQNMDQLIEMVNQLQSSDKHIQIVIGGAGATYLPDQLQPYRLQGDLEEWKQWFKRMDWD